MTRNVFILSFLLFLTVASAGRAEEWGRFSSDPKVVLVGGRDVILLEDFSYIESIGRTWSVPKGYRANGASIPKPFWSFIGGPLSGSYRNASIIHDYFCEFIGPSSDEVHLMFYHAMLANSVPQRKAWVMYKAVDWFGDDWEIVDAKLPAECKAGELFDPATCVLNNSGEVRMKAKPMSKARLEEFLVDLENDGFSNEVVELKALIFTEN